jgi:hypothetical protein
MDDTAGLGMRTAKSVLSLIRLPGRIFNGNVGEDFLRSINMKQADAYYQTLADVLTDPDSIGDIERAYNYLDKFDFGFKQAVTRGTTEGVEALTGEDKPYQPTGEQLDRMTEQLIERERERINQPQSFIDIDAFDEAQPALQTGVPLNFDPALSPTVLPRDEDRELAMRLRQRQGGIGSLS